MFFARETTNNVMTTTYTNSNATKPLELNLKKTIPL